MESELRLARSTMSIRPWDDPARMAALRIGLGRKRTDFEGPGMIRAQSETKQHAAQVRRSWECTAIAKAPPEFARPQAIAWIAWITLPPPKSPAGPAKARPIATEVFRGRVDDIIGGTAVITLFSEDGEPMTARWPEQELARESIRKGDLFELTMTDTGGAVIPSFRKVSRRPIPDDLWEEIERIKAAYSDLRTDDVDGDEEG
jgi:hypothetical protein